VLGLRPRYSPMAFSPDNGFSIAPAFCLGNARFFIGLRSWPSSFFYRCKLTSLRTPAYQADDTAQHMLWLSFGIWMVRYLFAEIHPLCFIPDALFVKQTKRLGGILRTDAGGCCP
jgi:hypothetical protein